jgi:hypothetical protein
MDSLIKQHYFSKIRAEIGLQILEDPKGRDFTVLLRTKKPMFAKSIKKRE